MMERKVRNIGIGFFIVAIFATMLCATVARAGVECTRVSIKVNSHVTSPSTQTGTVQFVLEKDHRLKIWQGKVAGVITSSDLGHVVLNHTVTDVVQVYPWRHSGEQQDPSGYRTVRDVSIVLYADPQNCRLHVKETSTTLVDAFGPLWEDVISDTYDFSLYGTVPSCESERKVNLQGTGYFCEYNNN